MNEFVRGKLKQVVVARNSAYKSSARNRPLSSNYEEVGLLGEWEFGKLVGLMPSLRTGRGGDGGYDFQIPVVFTVDVKTAKKVDRLLVEAGKVKADIYVLAWYMDGEDGGSVQLVGWCHAATVKSYEPCDTGRGIINHAVPAEKLRPMVELERMLGKWGKQ